MRGDAGDEGRMSLMDHLVELRGRIIKCAIAVAVGAAIGWMVYPWVLDTLTHPLREIENSQSITGGRLLLTDPLEGFFLRIKISAYIGIALAMPVLLWQLWQFVSPGLYSNERRYAVPFVASATLLFAARARPSPSGRCPRPCEFLQAVAADSFAYGYSGQKYLTLIVYMMLAFGGGFEFPVLLDLPAARRGHRPQAAPGLSSLRHRHHLRGRRGDHAQRRPDQPARPRHPDVHLL